MRPFSDPIRALALLAVLVLVPAQGATAQVGAFGGAPPAVSSGDEAAHFRSPIFTESAVFSPAGVLGGLGLVGLTTGTVDATGVEYEVLQTTASIYYALSEAVTLGTSVQPWNQLTLRFNGLEESESGSGNGSLFARARVWESDDAQSALAASGAVGIPLADNGFGTDGVVLDLGGAFSHQLESASLHGSAGLVLPTSDLDGESVVRVSGGAMVRIGGRTAVGVELLSRFSNGESVIDLAPGFRFQGSGVIVDAGVLFNASTSLDEVYDGALLVSVRFGR